MQKTTQKRPKNDPKKRPKNDPKQPINNPKNERVGSCNDCFFNFCLFKMNILQSSMKPEYSFEIIEVY